MKKLTIPLLLLVLAFVLPTNVVAQSFSGKFTATHDEQFFELYIYRNQSGRFEGKMTIDGRIMILNAIKLGEKIGGQIAGPDETRNFIARMAGASILIEFEQGKLVRFNPEQ